MGGGCSGPSPHPCYHWDHEGDSACATESCGVCHMEHGQGPENWKTKCVDKNGQGENMRMISPRNWARTMISSRDVGILRAAQDNKKWDD